MPITYPPNPFRIIGAGLGVPASGIVVPTGRIQYYQIPFNAIITGWSLIADQSGSAVVDIWKLNAAVPTVTNTITASAKPTLSSQQLASSTVLTGWTVAAAINDIFAFNVDSASTINSLVVELFATVS